MGIDYTKAKIYKIWSPSTGKTYVGSTTQPLHKRFHEHKRRFSYWKQEKWHYITVFDVFECGDANIELVEEWKAC